MRVLRVVGRSSACKDAGVVDLLAAQQVANVLRERIVADRSRKDDVRVQRAQIVGDVAGAAERERVVGYGDDGNRRLRRDPRNGSPNPFVDHQVADDQDSAAGCALEERARVGHHQRGHRIPPSKIRRCSTRSQTMCAMT